uniref:Uncharacterized protein n=1 Tax=Cynoglossus semilaevis TaxID=244447 RepID=A0A3P8ULL1_CYNSE
MCVISVLRRTPASVSGSCQDDPVSHHVPCAVTGQPSPGQMPSEGVDNLHLSPFCQEGFDTCAYTPASSTTHTHTHAQQERGSLMSKDSRSDEKGALQTDSSVARGPSAVQRLCLGWRNGVWVWGFPF